MSHRQIRNQKDSVPTNATTESPHKLLLRWLSPDEEQAERRYQSLRPKLVALLAGRGELSSFAEEMADETLDRVGRKLAAGEVIRNPEPMAYLHGVAMNVLREYRRNTSREVSLEDLSPHNVNKQSAAFFQQHQQEERELWLDCLDKFLGSLPPEEKALLQSCYHDDPHQQAANRRKTASRLNLTEGSFRAHLHRICQTLKRKVRACVERHQK